jgi:hypothetical protein
MRFLIALALVVGLATSAQAEILSVTLRVDGMT